MRADRRKFLKAAGAALGTVSLAPTIVRDALAQPNVIKVAAIHDLSGGLDIYGRPMVDCLNFAVEEINGAGGLLGRHIKLISYDAQSNIQLYTQFATEAATKERVAVVQGGITSASRGIGSPSFHTSTLSLLGSRSSRLAVRVFSVMCPLFCSTSCTVQYSSVVSPSSGCCGTVDCAPSASGSENSSERQQPFRVSIVLLRARVR